MVRLIAAGLVEVGHGRITPAKFKKLLEAGDRTGLLVEAAPPNGLYLDKVSWASGTSSTDHVLTVLMVYRLTTALASGLGCLSAGLGCLMLSCRFTCLVMATHICQMWCVPLSPAAVLVVLHTAEQVCSVFGFAGIV
jgi:hypothetical protein